MAIILNRIIAQNGMYQLRIDTIQFYERVKILERIKASSLYSKETIEHRKVYNYLQS
jgi:hypothetical protein